MEKKKKCHTENRTGDLSLTKQVAIPPNPIPTAEEKVEGVFGKWHEKYDLDFDFGFWKIAQGPAPGGRSTRCTRQNWRGAFLRSGGSIADDIFASRKEKKRKGATPRFEPATSRLRSE
jgi:hypothetical protein